MKKIIAFSIGLLFSSVYAQSRNEIDIAQAAAVLVRNTDFIETCHVLSAQGLTHEQIIEQLMQTDENRAYFWIHRKDEGEGQYKETLERIEHVSKVAGACLLVLVFAVGIFLELYSPNKNNFYSMYDDCDL